MMTGRPMFDTLRSRTLITVTLRVTSKRVRDEGIGVSALRAAASLVGMNWWRKPRIDQREIKRLAAKYGVRGKLKVRWERATDQILYLRGPWWGLHHQTGNLDHLIILAKDRIYTTGYAHTLAHEFCHAIQSSTHNGRDAQRAQRLIPYESRPYELEAEEFAKEHRTEFEAAIVV
jgi:hypothetical protein